MLFPHDMFGKSSRLGVHLYHISLFTKVFVSSNFWGVTLLVLEFAWCGLSLEGGFFGSLSFSSSKYLKKLVGGYK